MATAKQLKQMAKIKEIRDSSNASADLAMTATGNGVTAAESRAAQARLTALHGDAEAARLIKRAAERGTGGNRRGLLGRRG